MTMDNRDPVRAAEREACDKYAATTSFNAQEREAGWHFWAARAAISTPNGWVAVSERLPEKPYEYVLVFVHRPERPHFRELNFVHVLALNGKGCWGEDIDGEWAEEENVTHWMPLPDPPKEPIKETR